MKNGELLNCLTATKLRPKTAVCSDVPTRSRTASCPLSHFFTQKVALHKSVANANQPPSLLVVVTSSAESLSLPFHITHNHAYAARPFRICTNFSLLYNLYA
jgi:hypothetical protein